MPVFILNLRLFDTVFLYSITSVEGERARRGGPHPSENAR
jgi:hypothetical protein